jgi:hypothetical protein
MEKDGLGRYHLLIGKITKKYINENGQYCVDIEPWAKNQRWLGVE